LKGEISGLQNCLPQLKNLSTKDEKALSVIKSFGLQDIVEACAEACETLRAIIKKRANSVPHDWWLKLQFVLNAKEIQRARDNVNTAKQTTILAVVVTQL
jgi:hypothetical protein